MRKTTTLFTMLFLTLAVFGQRNLSNFTKQDTLIRFKTLKSGNHVVEFKYKSDGKNASDEAVREVTIKALKRVYFSLEDSSQYNPVYLWIKRAKNKYVIYHTYYTGEKLNKAIFNFNDFRKETNVVVLN